MKGHFERILACILNYSYDGTSKLTSVVVPSVQGITQKTFVYDNAGNRIADNTNNLYNYYKYDLSDNLNYSCEWGTYQQLTNKKNIKNGLITNYSYTPELPIIMMP